MLLLWPTDQVLNAKEDNHSQPSSNGNEFQIQNISENDTEETFRRSFFTHTKNYYHNTGLLSKVRELLNISTGGERTTTFIGIGNREQSIRWDGEAILNTYNKILNKQTNKYQLNGSDIPNGFSSSLLEN